MALIDCPECGAAVSSSAVSCPSCAYPIGVTSKGQVPARARRAVPMTPAKAVWDATKSIAARIALGGVFFVSGVVWEAPPVIIGSLIIGASCIPLWLKARRVARGLSEGTGDVAALEERVRAFIADAEDRQISQLADIEEQTSHRLSEMEERLDFAERLLIKHQERERHG